MRAFDVYLNHKKLCRAGVGDDGVLSAIVNWVTGEGRRGLFLQVGGLITPQGEHVRWVSQKRLRVGDRISVKVVDARSADKPSKAYRINPAETLKAKKRYVSLDVQGTWMQDSGRIEVTSLAVALSGR